MQSSKDWLSANWYYLVGAVLLCVAIAEMPYGYYQLLRVFVCVLGAVGAYQSYQSGKNAWVWLLGALAILFNPIWPIYFTQNTWAILDLAAALLLLIFVLVANSQEWSPVHKTRRHLIKRYRIYAILIAVCVGLACIPYFEHKCVERYTRDIDYNAYVKDMDDREITIAAESLQIDAGYLKKIRDEEDAMYMNRGIYQRDTVTKLAYLINEDIEPEEVTRSFEEQCQIF